MAVENDPIYEDLGREVFRRTGRLAREDRLQIRNIAREITAAERGLRMVDFESRPPQVALEAGMTFALVHLRDALLMLDRAGFRVSNQGPMIQAWPKEGDLTAFIVVARNAACHVDSETYRIEPGLIMHWGIFHPGGSLQVTPQSDRIINLTQHDMLLTIGRAQLYFNENLYFALRRSVDQLWEMVDAADHDSPPGDQGEAISCDIELNRHISRPARS